MCLMHLEVLVSVLVRDPSLCTKSFKNIETKTCLCMVGKIAEGVCVGVCVYTHTSVEMYTMFYNTL